jgi:hypothetical protein
VPLPHCKSIIVKTLLFLRSSPGLRRRSIDSRAQSQRFIPSGFSSICIYRIKGIDRSTHASYCSCSMLVLVTGTPSRKATRTVVTP